MIIDNQIAKVKWSRRNKEHYEEMGYSFTNYGDIFNVRVEDLMKGSHQDVNVQCDYCGQNYTMQWKNYYINIIKKQKCSCNDCKVIKKNDVTLSERQTMLYNKISRKCQENGYLLLTNKEEIKNNTTYIKYICPIHGEHEMMVNNLINGKKCPECAIDNAAEKYKLSVEEVKSRISSLGGIVLNADEYKNSNEKNLQILCSECGNPFTTSLSCFERYGGQVCPDCSGSESVGEKKIRHYLENHKIIFKQYEWFPDCRDINPLPFDFYLPKYNIIIEFDGRQHFGDTGYFTYSFEQTKRHDEIKNNYCKANGFYLIRIPYWNIDKIDEILDKELILHEDIV